MADRSRSIVRAGEDQKQVIEALTGKTLGMAPIGVQRAQYNRGELGRPSGYPAPPPRVALTAVPNKPTLNSILQRLYEGPLSFLVR